MKKLLLLLTLLYFPPRSYSCTCDPVYDSRGFCEVIASAQHKPMFCLVKARILSYYEYGAYMQVIENIYNTANNDTILVWGDNGACCRPTFVTMFSIGDTVVMSLEQTDFMGNFIAPGLPDYEDSTDYVLQGCGAYFLRYHNGEVIGGFNSNLITETITYDSFKNQIEGCLSLTGLPESSQVQVHIFPNPFSSTLQVKTTGVINRITIINSIGEQVFLLDCNTQDAFADLHHLHSGVYLLIVDLAGREKRYSYTIVKE